MAKLLVSIIIVNWNGGEIFKDCLISLEKLSYPEWELILIDNGSTDGSENLVKDFKLKYRRFKLIKNSENFGFAKANNQGLEISRGKYILLLNNDTKVSPNLLKTLVDKMESDHLIGALQPKIFLMDKDGFLDNAGTFLTQIGFLEHWGFMQKDGLEFRKEREIFSAKGACLFFRKSVSDEIGLFDSDFFNYFEESDFCWRVWLMGLRVVFIPETFIYHKVGFSSKRQKQILVNYHSLKNMLCTFIKNLNSKNLIIMGSLFIFLIVGLSLYYLIKLRLQQFLMVWKAIFWNLININKTLNKRKIVQSHRVWSDKQIFDIVMHPISFAEMLAHFNRVEANFK